MSSLTQTLFSCTQFIFKTSLPKKSCLYSFCAHIQCLAYSTAQYLASYFSKGLPSNTELIHQIKLLRDWTSQLMEMYWNQAYQESHLSEKKTGQQEMARLRLLEQTQVLWMLMQAVNKEELCRTNIQLSCEISTTPQWDQMGSWQHIDTQIIVLALQSTVCVAQPGEKQQGSELSGKLMEWTRKQCWAWGAPQQGWCGCRWVLYLRWGSLHFTPLLKQLRLQEESDAALAWRKHICYWLLSPKQSRGFLWTEKELQPRTRAQHRPHSGRKRVWVHHHHNLLLTPHGAGSRIQTLTLYRLKIKQLNQLMGRNCVQDQNL